MGMLFVCVAIAVLLGAGAARAVGRAAPIRFDRGGRLRLKGAGPLFLFVNEADLSEAGGMLTVTLTLE